MNSRLVYHWFARQALRPIPITRTGFYFIAGFALVGLLLMQDFPMHPVSGWFIGILGAGAVVVAVRTEHLTPWEKVGWIIIAFFFCGLEMHVLYKDKEQQEAAFTAARAEETKSFRGIANGLTEAIRENQQNFNSVMSSTNTLLAENLGGDSFCFLTLESGALAWKNQAVPVFTHQGKYPLYGIGAQIIERNCRNLCAG